MGPLSRQQRIEQFERTCRECGLPLTLQRRAVFEAVLDREDHPRADQVYDRIRSQVGGISRATVYRILGVFVRLGLITKICHHGTAARFDPKINQHHHLVCMKCEKITDTEDRRMNNVPWPDVRGRGFEISDYHICFRGVCSDCRRKLSKGRGPGHEVANRSTRRGERARRMRSRKKRTTKP